jgi:type I restriction enzyme S subunit
MFHIKLSNLVTLKYGKNQRKVEDKNGKYPIIGTGGVIGFADSYLFQGPSILFGRKGTIGEVFYQKTPFWAIDTVFYTIINYKYVLPQYLYYKLSTIDFKKYDEGTTIPSLRTETLNKIEIDIHGLQEQQHIVGTTSSLQ